MPKVFTKVKRHWGVRSHSNGRKAFKQMKMKRAANLAREVAKEAKAFHHT